MPASDDQVNHKRDRGNFGLVRFVLAAAVIVSHSPDLIDGNRSREPLVRLFGTVTLGEVAVLGFFLISGYLLTLSVRTSPSLFDYALKRVARIYPGFCVASAFCVLIVAPLAGGWFGGISFKRSLLAAVLLQIPQSPGAFVGTPHPWLNGAMWTIQYEFGCYVLLAGLFVAGLLRHRWIVLAGTSALVLVTFLGVAIDPAAGAIVLGAPPLDILRFASAFLVGTTARLWLTPAWHDGRVAACCVALLIPALFLRSLAEPAVLLLGGYALIWLCEHEALPLLGRVGRRTDLSYGIYLYGWPLQKLAIVNAGLVAPALVDAVSLLGAAGLAAVSWHFVERPSMRTAAAFARWRRARARPGRETAGASDEGYARLTS